jgi:hypothetical protein
MVYSENSYLSDTNEENLASNVETFSTATSHTSLDSLTILNSQSVEQ